MAWTKELPSVPGWYWWRYQKGDRRPEVVWVDDDGEVLSAGITAGTLSVKAIGGEWSGPLSPPGG